MLYKKSIKRRSSKGQGITEYASVIAFVCVIIAMAFNFAHGSLFSGISNSYSSVSGNLDQLNNAAVNWGQ